MQAQQKQQWRRSNVRCRCNIHKRAMLKAGIRSDWNGKTLFKGLCATLERLLGAKALLVSF